MDDSSQDIASSRYLRADLRASISELDARILDLENSLAAVRREREKLQSRLADYAYPVLTLPAEITSKIFTHFLPIYPLCSLITGLLSPMLLGQICRQWRDIALGTPRLWSAIEIEIHSDDPDRFSARVDLLRAWLIRSKTCPLSLSVQIDRVPEHRSVSLRHLTDTVLIHSTRLEYMNLLLPFHDLHWGGLQCPFPLLRDLTLGTSDDVLADDATTPFCDAPALTTVHLVDFSTYPAALPWSQLTTISVEGWEPLQVARILRYAVSLINFSGTVWDDFHDVQIMPPLLHLQSLILFEFEEGPSGWRATRKLLDALTAPALRHLTVSGGRLEPLSFDTIASLIARSQCSLESLHVTHSQHYKEPDVRALFPSIKVVKVFAGDEKAEV
ncbi:hypothetical protein C8J57DRAFT_1734148 [Mycena rebaudengoi]|nr:hypothetical protein C8J57DRAFT_1734148 [Mycena rebaudengoi]